MSRNEGKKIPLEKKLLGLYSNCLTQVMVKNSVSHTGIGTMTDLSTIDIEKLFTKQAELETLVQEYKHENECLKAEQKKLSELCSTMKGNDEHSKNKEKFNEQIQDLKAQINEASVSQSTLAGNAGLPDFAMLRSIFQLVYPNPPGVGPDSLCFSSCVLC